MGLELEFATQGEVEFQLELPRSSDRHLPFTLELVTSFMIEPHMLQAISEYSLSDSVYPDKRIVMLSTCYPYLNKDRSKFHSASSPIFF